MSKKGISVEQRGQLQVVESAVRGWLRDGIHPKIIATALNNAFCHGEAMFDGGFNFSEETLGEIFDGIEAFSSACKKVE